MCIQHGRDLQFTVDNVVMLAISSTVDKPTDAPKRDSFRWLASATPARPLRTVPPATGIEKGS